MQSDMGVRVGYDEKVDVQSFSNPSCYRDKSCHSEQRVHTCLVISLWLQS